MNRNEQKGVRRMSSHATRRIPTTHAPQYGVLVETGMGHVKRRRRLKERENDDVSDVE